MINELALVQPEIAKLSPKHLKQLNKLANKAILARQLDNAWGLANNCVNAAKPLIINPLFLAVSSFVAIDYFSWRTWKRKYTLPNGTQIEHDTGNTMIGGTSATFLRAGVAGIATVMALGQSGLLEKLGEAAAPIIGAVGAIK